jgi:2'-5' RNA ligase
MSADQYLFVALHPGSSLGTLLQGAKDYTIRQVGQQLYADHPPHLTLFVAAFDEPMVLHAQLEALTRTLPPLEIELCGWHVFYNDVLTAHHTLTCGLTPPAIAACRRLQTAVIQALSPVRNVAASAARYVSRWRDLTPERRSAVEQFGYPFVGDDWQPHFTVASIDPQVWESVWPGLEEQPITGKFTCSELKLYRVDGGRHAPLASYELTGG